MALDEGAAGAGRVAPHRLDHQAPGWHVPPHPGTPRSPDVLFAYHDRVTLGPTAMKVLAKKTGLMPKDL